jgi:cephalosporin-C deacetylase
MFVDMPLEELRSYRPDPPAAADFDAFWKETLRVARGHDLGVARRPWDVRLPHVAVHDLSFRGFDGQPIRAWFLRSSHATAPAACVVTFDGYGGGRGLPHEWLFWPSAGAALLVMDCRGQGSGHRRGDTPDLAPPSGPHQNGFLTLGIESPDTYYYRRVYTDAVRAVEAARTLPEVDASRVVVAGASQGGGIALAVSGLVPDLAAALVDVPFLCHMARAVEITDEYPYQELRLWLRTHRNDAARGLRTVAYADGVNFASRATAPALFSVGLMDEICPPSTVYAAFNRYAGEARMDVWPYAGHEGGGADQAVRQLDFLRSLGVLA